MSDKDRVWDLLTLCANLDLPKEQRQKYYSQALEIVRNPTTKVKRTHPVQFEAFWEVYPRKVGKEEAEKAYTKCTDSHEVIMKGLQYYIKTKPEYADYLHPSTFISKKRYKDAPEDNRPINKPDWPMWKVNLAKKLGETPVSVWFRDVEYTDGVFICPTALVVNWIKTKFAQDVYSVMGQFEVRLKNG